MQLFTYHTYYYVCMPIKLEFLVVSFNVRFDDIVRLQSRLTLQHNTLSEKIKQIKTYQMDVVAPIWAKCSTAAVDIVRYRKNSPPRCWRYTCDYCDYSNRRLQLLSGWYEEIAAVVVFADETDDFQMMTLRQKMRADSSVSNWSSSFVQSRNTPKHSAINTKPF